MIDWEQFHFLRPWWLAALVPLGVLLYLIATRRLGSRNWESVCDRALLPYILIGGEGGGRDHRRTILAAVCSVIAVLALAGPAWDRLPQPVFSTGGALVIALDLSRSMDAADLSPSRIGRARFKINDILRARREGQMALLAYAGDAFTVAPLTDDTATIASLLPALAPEIMPVQGNRTDLALRLAGELLHHAGLKRGDVLLVTDEVDFDRSDAAAAALRDAGYRLSVFGVGTEHGVPVPLADGSFLKDERGEIVIPVLREKSLRETAEMGGGVYVRMSLDDTDINRLSASLADRPMRDDSSETQFRTDAWREQGPWLVLALLPLAALAFRRGYLFAVLFLLAPIPQPAQALDWEGMWRRPDQQGLRAIEEGHPERAATLFRRPDWKGAAQYRAQNYAGAAESLAESPDADSLYNRGNALARLGRYEEALRSYDQALSRDPGHEDARFNRQVVEEALKQQQQEPQQGQQQGQQGQEAQQQQSQTRRQESDGANRDHGSESDESGNGKKQDGPAAEPGSQNGTHRTEQNDAGAAEQDTAGTREESTKAARASGAIDDGSPTEPDTAAEAQAAPSPDETDGAGPSDDDAMVASGEAQPDEQQQATEQWLRRIPDDPAGLLRRKFRYQYQQRQGQPAEEEQSW